MVCGAEILSTDGLNPDLLTVYSIRESKHLCAAQEAKHSLGIQAEEENSC